MNYATLGQQMYERNQERLKAAMPKDFPFEPWDKLDSDLQHYWMYAAEDAVSVLKSNGYQFYQLPDSLKFIERERSEREVALQGGPRE
jgi:hypothetical protein